MGLKITEFSFNFSSSPCPAEISATDDASYVKITGVLHYKITLHKISHDQVTLPLRKHRDAL